MKVYHVPTSSVRVFIPQRYFSEEKKSSFHMTVCRVIFTFGLVSALTFKYSPKYYPPTAYAHTNHATPSPAFITSSGQLNIAKPQADVLQWHQRIGNYNIWGIQRLMIPLQLDIDHIIRLQLSSTTTCDIPLCRACQHGKGSKTPIDSLHVQHNPDMSDVIKEDGLLPGGAVSIDQ